MESTPSLIQDLALILVTAGIVTIIFKKLKQPLVLGYIMAGVLVSPNLPATFSVMDQENIETWAEIGVMFLLFTLGLDFSFKKIIKMGLAPIIAALSIVFCMMTLGSCVGTMMGWSSLNSLFLAGMLAMSSTTIIYKAFNDLGLRQQQFSSLVMSVLILEDILAIVMLVVLGTVSAEESGGNSALLKSLLSIVFFLTLWFVVGLFFVPTFLKKARNIINDEVLLIVALAMCCAMYIFADSVGFSPTFGSFVMGSILAETVEAKRIERLVEPIKNLFGAIFFVSVGMLVNLQVVAEQWTTVIIITLTIILGQSIFGTLGFMLSGQPLKTAMRCGFSMAQIGEFAFIIASLGAEKNVLSPFMYPVIVTVSVITTFFTPYMIRGAIPVYNVIEKHLSTVWIRRINKLSDIAPSNYDHSEGYWKPLLMQMLTNTIIYMVLSISIILIVYSWVDDLIIALIPGIWSRILCALLTILLMAPFLRAMIMKKNKSVEFKALWTGSRHNRAPLVFTIIARVMLALGLIFFVCTRQLHFSNAIVICISIVAIALMVYSKRVKLSSIKLERLFIQNMKSKELAAKASSNHKPLFEGHLLDRDIHIAEVTVPQDSLWAGKSLAALELAKRFGVHISSIHRGNTQINIPSGTDIIFPHDTLSAIGSDTQLTNLNNALQQEVVEMAPDTENKEMILRRFAIGKGSPFLGKTLITSGLRNHYNCMLVGKEEAKENLTSISPTYVFQSGDILWIVGEQENIYHLSKEI